jgi:Ca2+-binding RTX toxin-like protein
MRRLVLMLAVMAAALVLASGMALALSKIGTNGPDTLRGTNANDDLLGMDGNDNLFALDGMDNLLGGAGRDNVWGGNERRPGGGDKNLAGGSGNDAVLGGTGSDSILGGPGNDYVDGSPNSDNVAGEEGNDVVFEGGLHEAYKDNLSGGPGNDWVAPLNDPAYGDVVTCGSGFDQVLADSKDVVAADCEKVLIGLASEEEFFEAIPQSFEKGLPPNP